MDSLLASYASSDEEDNHPQPPHKPPPPPTSSSSFKPTSSLFSSLPKPQLSSSSSSSSKLFSSIPPPKSSSFSSLLPPPISQSNPNPNPKSSGKKVVQFHPPKFNQNLDLRDDDDDEDEDEEERERKKARQMGHVTSAKSFLSTIPAPKNSGFSALGGASGGRRTTIDATVTEPVAPEPVVELNVEGSQVGFDDGSNLYSYDGVSYGNYEGYGQQQYYDGGNSWSYGGNDGVVSGEAVQGTVSSGVDSFVAFGGGGGGGGKRRKDQVPAEILEVKQDELMKNRPTEDKSKLTGIAFGPSYQPASSKGKPSKLHKRKHQIGALYFDMRQREMELSERRAKGFLTKAETQAKYGW